MKNKLETNENKPKFNLLLYYNNFFEEREVLDNHNIYIKFTTSEAGLLENLKKCSSNQYRMIILEAFREKMSKIDEFIKKITEINADVPIYFYFKTEVADSLKKYLEKTGVTGIIMGIDELKNTVNTIAITKKEALINNNHNKSGNVLFHENSSLLTNTHLKNSQNELVFGYILKAVSTIELNDEKFYGQIQVFDNFLETFIYRITSQQVHNVKIKLRYFNINAQFSLAILIYYTNIHEDKSSNLNEFIEHLNHLLLTESMNTPIYFEKINNLDELEPFKDFIDPEYDILFKRDEIELPSMRMGFKPDLIKNTNSVFKPPKIIKPLISIKENLTNEIVEDLKTQNLFLKNVSLLKPNQSIDVLIKPIINNELENDIFKKHIQNLKINKTEQTEAEILFFNEYLNYDHNYIGIVLTKHLKNDVFTKSLIKNYFFNNYVVKELDFKGNNVSNLFVDSQEYRIPYLYNITNIFNLIKLPKPTPKHLKVDKIEYRKSSLHYYEEIKNTENTMRIGLKNNKTVGLPFQSLSRHLYILGQTGTGKSTLLINMILEHIIANKGFTLFDPHGDLSDMIIHVLNSIPFCANKLEIINPIDLENTKTINILEHTDNLEKSMIIKELLNSFYSLYTNNDAFGPSFELHFTNGMMLLMDKDVNDFLGPLNLSDFNKIYNNREFLDEALLFCNQSDVTSFYKNALETCGDQSFENWAAYVTSKITKFVNNEISKNLFCSTNNIINLKDIINQNKFLILKLDKGKIGSDNARFIGSNILSKIIISGMSRSNLDIHERIPHTVFVDECQNFAFANINEGLAELRKYNVHLVLANQALSQLDDKIILSILGNVGSQIYFRPGIYDYKTLEPYLSKNISADDILQLPNFQCICRLMIDNKPTDSFIMQTQNFL